jgi:hypothetical protein
LAIGAFPILVIAALAPAARIQGYMHRLGSRIRPSFVVVLAVGLVVAFTELALLVLAFVLWRAREHGKWSMDCSNGLNHSLQQTGV